jgi:hypothetical protein
MKNKDKDFWPSVTDPVKKPPDLSGKYTKAWLCNIDEGRRIMKVKPEQDASICHWVIEAPWAHPAWHSYSIFCHHLRPMPGSDVPVAFYLEGATHEMLVFCLDPTKGRESLIETGIVKDANWLEPANFAAQFIELDDELACDRIKRTVQEIVDEKLSPDTDFRREWIHRFGNNMMKHD